MQIKLITKLLTLAMLFALMLACKKDNPSNSNAKLVGSWTETPLEAQFGRTFYFGEDGSFTLHSTYVGSAPAASTLNGNYRIDGNKLVITIMEEIGRQQGFPPVHTQVNYPYLDKLTFTVAGNKLTLNYISYPADAPVATKMVLIKH
jgi:hypothetical protein